MQKSPDKLCFSESTNLLHAAFTGGPFFFVIYSVRLMFLYCE